MSDYQGKHRRGAWGEFVGRERDTLDDLELNDYVGRHRDDSEHSDGIEDVLLPSDLGAC